MTIKIIINGAYGRMGKVTVPAIENDSELQLVGTIGSNDNLAKAIQDLRPDVVIDFTNAEVAVKNMATIIAHNARPVFGTSGLLANDREKFVALCADKKLGGIIAPNFSVAAVLLMKYARDAAQYFPHVEIIEAHHDGKLDSPSGTAMRTAEMIAETRNATDQPERITKENIPGSRGATHHGIPIHAIRLPGFVAQEQVIFGDTGETLMIQHSSINRESFMPGVVLACKKVMELHELVYGLEHVL